MYEWDEIKREANKANHQGIDFTLAFDFEWETALIVEDSRQDYSETRYQALGLINNRLYMLVFTFRAVRVRIISLRKANKKEYRKYVS
jgi:uncharacterized protein